MWRILIITASRNLAPAAGILPSRGEGAGSKNGQFNYPCDVALDAQGNLYVADRDNGRVQKFDPAGASLARLGQLLARETGSSMGPPGVVVDGQGNLYVTDHNNSRIQKFDSGGNYLTQWGSEGSGAGTVQSSRRPRQGRPGKLLCGR